MKLAALTTIMTLSGVLVVSGQAQHSELSQQALMRQIQVLEEKNSELIETNKQITKSLGLARKNSEEARSELEQMRKANQALGIYPNLDNNDRLVQVVADREVLERQLSTLRSSAIEFTSIVRDYLKSALVADPDSRVKVETSLRSLDLALGLRQKPQPSRDVGTLQSANIVSIDSQSGLLVLNAGATADFRVGMTFLIFRENQKIGEAIIAGVRPDISGALVQTLEDNQVGVRLGDTASIKIQ